MGEIQPTRRVPLGRRPYSATKGRGPCLCPACIGRGEYGPILPLGKEGKALPEPMPDVPQVVLEIQECEEWAEE